MSYCTSSSILDNSQSNRSYCRRDLHNFRHCIPCHRCTFRCRLNTHPLRRTIGNRSIRNPPCSSRNSQHRYTAHQRCIPGKHRNPMNNCRTFHRTSHRNIHPHKIRTSRLPCSTGPHLGNRRNPRNNSRVIRSHCMLRHCYSSKRMPRSGMYYSLHSLFHRSHWSAGIHW